MSLAMRVKLFAAAVVAVAMPGLWFHEFQPGRRIEHPARLHVTQEDNAAFCRLTRNTQPLHFDVEAARAQGFRDVLVNGLYTFAASVGMSVPETTQGTLIANLGYGDVLHPAPVHPGDTLHVETVVAEARGSSKPGRGIVVLEHVVRNQEDVEVCRYRRTVLVREGP